MKSRILRSGAGGAVLSAIVVRFFLRWNFSRADVDHRGEVEAAEDGLAVKRVGSGHSRDQSGSRLHDGAKFIDRGGGDVSH